MADAVNPYANPYLPSFVSQRPRMNDTRPAQLPGVAGTVFSQIHYVHGFEGADIYNLSPGSSEILVDDDPNLARIYVTAKDTNGQMLVQGFNLVPVERPKQVTMNDLSSAMNQILERLNRLEEGQNDQSNHGNAWKGSKQPVHAGNQSNGRNGANAPESAGNGQSGNGK